MLIIRALSAAWYSKDDAELITFDMTLPIMNVG